MKLTKIIFLATMMMISATVFGQKTEPKTEAKTSEIKPAPAAKLPTVKEILDKYVQAIGGREKFEKIRTRTTKGTVELSPMGVKGTVEVYQSAPDKSYSKLTLNGIGELIQSYDGKTAWTVNPLQGNRDKTGDELLQTKLLSTFHRETNFEKLFTKMEVKGIEKVGDKEAYIISATPPGLEPHTFYFDKETGLLVREDSTAISPEGKMPTKSFYEDYREVDGLKMPFKLRTVLTQLEFTMTFTEIKNSPKFDENIFSKPKE